MTDRNEAELKKGLDIAMDVFYAGTQQCKTEDQLAGFVRIICTLGAKTIHGMDGKKFKKDFLRAAISDPEKMTPMKPH